MKGKLLRLDSIIYNVLFSSDESDFYTSVKLAKYLKSQTEKIKQP